MKIKKYIQYLREQDEIDINNLDNKLDSSEESQDKSEEKTGTYEESTAAVKELIENTVEKSGGSFEDLKDSFIKDPKETKIEGLINDSDIYDFYLKYRNEIDELLGEVNFYDEVPSEINVFGLYDYITKGTMKAVEELVKKL